MKRNRWMRNWMTIIYKEKDDHKGNDLCIHIKGLQATFSKCGDFCTYILVYCIDRDKGRGTYMLCFVCPSWEMRLIYDCLFVW